MEQKGNKAPLEKTHQIKGNQIPVPISCVRNGRNFIPVAFYIVEFQFIHNRCVRRGFATVCSGAGFFSVAPTLKKNPHYFQQLRESRNVPVSLELVIKRQLGARGDQFGGEKSNSELPIHSPLKQGKNQGDELLQKPGLALVLL